MLRLMMTPSSAWTSSALKVESAVRKETLFPLSMVSVPETLSLFVPRIPSTTTSALVARVRPVAVIF